MGTSPVHLAMADLAANLDAANIPYAIAGAMALNEHGHIRATTDVDILLTPAGLLAFKARYLGRGYVERFPGSRGMRDTVHQVPVDVLLTGQFPGDGKEQPVSFPDPELAWTLGSSSNLRFLTLSWFVTLKLASGMTAPHRLKDLSDVLELIVSRGLSSDFRESLDPYVREKYDELWRAAQASANDPNQG